MRLFTHLLISHSAPVLVVTLALALTLTALVRISLLLTDLSESEFVALRDESALHASAWALDVSARHARRACESGGASAAAGERIRAKADALRPLAESAAPGPMRDLAEGYLQNAAKVLSGDVCENLLGPVVEPQRELLDEALTNVWVDRMRDLHGAVTEKEEQARKVAVSATLVGIPLAASSLVIAMLIARRVARIVTRPLSSLSAVARRIGRGDFREPVHAEGPSEVLALAAELEHMRLRLAQLEALKQGFLASVSHELRTPLSKVREALALLEDGAVGKFEGRELRVVQIARAACEREIRLVTTLLNVSRLRAGNPVNLRKGAAIDRVLADAVKDETADALAAGVTVRLEKDGAPATCSLDPDLVERAIANLIRNAVSVSQRGQVVTVRRTLHVSEHARSGRWIFVTVTDEGPGVPESIRDTVFNPFVTTAVPGAGRAPGVGLGLALAREVALAHGGSLELTRTGPAGTTFTLSLPAEEAGRERAVDPGANREVAACAIDIGT